MLKLFNRRVSIVLAVLLLGLLILIPVLDSMNNPGEHQAGQPPHIFAEGFRNPWATFAKRGFGDLLRWQWDRLRGNAPHKPERYNFTVIPNDGSALRNNTEALTITWVGHSTTLIQIEGMNILTDPIWSERCSPFTSMGPRRDLPAVPAFENLPAIDAVIISHNHYDHLDKQTILRLGNRVHYFVPLLVSLWLQDNGIKKAQITELDWWQEAEFRGKRFVCTPAQHFSGRSFHDRDKTLWCSWTIIGVAHRVYFSGDSGYFPGFREIAARYGPLDIALLPIGAYRPRWFMKPVHMDPAEAARAFLDLQARVMIPIHWGTFDLADEPLDEPPVLLDAAVDSLKIDRDLVWLMKPGETRVFSHAAISPKEWRAGEKFVEIGRTFR